MPAVALQLPDRKKKKKNPWGKLLFDTHRLGGFAASGAHPGIQARPVHPGQNTDVGFRKGREEKGFPYSCPGPWPFLLSRWVPVISNAKPCYQY